ncbi:ParB/RepB/Spo0J family partition protein [Shimia thalassica]|uniref:ParB/RepB/Spo0J family partition protein n=1 Tax=Shimia thalassica TaxID=1715693 RepID=UPI00273607E3|nr:ParB/RepB/Spo0J family partition protein [Shimia thalassica]MDP2520858.1 ParB/RepB/Spo0J family partition protein [Shimia thalassica]
MAKRRKLVAPSSDDLNRIEAEFRRETSAPDSFVGNSRGAAPIAQVAADTAALVQPVSATDRAETARLQASDASLKHAQDHGLLMVELPLNDIDADVMIRDRTVLDETQMQELRESIAANGLRLPIEVFEMAEAGKGEARHGLLSGYRRLMAMRGLLSLTGDPKYNTIRVIVRPRTKTDGAFVAMVEENEVRAQLSHFERGRISVIAAQQGAFVNTEEAVNRLFATSSKAKRSKVRSFALIFEEMGDMLTFPDALTEKHGLQLAQALRQGGEGMLRDGLASGQPQSAEEEWALLDAGIQKMEAVPRDPRRGGRPTTTPVAGWKNADTLVTSSGITIRKQQDSKGYVLRFEGRKLDDDLMNSLLAEIQTLLEAP